MKKFTILIAILASFGIGWFSNEKLGPKPDEDASAKEASDDAKKDEPNEKSEQEEKEDGNKAIPVAVETVALGDISSSVSFNTSVTSEQSLDIHSEIDGIIASIEVEEGDHVKTGDPLLTLVNDDHRIQKEESKANLDNLQNEFNRAQSMVDEELITTQEFETKRYQYTQARLQHERDNLRYERSIVRSPFDGIVSERFTQTGARITPATQLFHIVNTSELITRVFIPERLLDSVKVDQPVVIESGSLPGKRWEGVVKRIAPTISNETGTFKATIAIDSDDNSLPTGLFVSARILTDTHAGAPLLPKQAIVYENEKQFVYVIEDDQAHKREIEPGITDDKFVEALSAIKAGDRVIVQGQVGLKDEAHVKVVDEAGDETKTAQSETEEPESDENAT